MAVAEAYARGNLPQSSKAMTPLSSFTLNTARQLVNGSGIHGDTYANLVSETDMNCAMAIALPIALLTHESHSKFIAELNLIAIAQTHWEAMLVMGGTIHQCIADKWHTQQFIPNTYHLIPQEYSDLIESLAKVQSGLEADLSLNLIRRHQPYQDLVFPIYSFLTTPKDYVLTVKRALYLGESAAACALAGALSGTYNGSSSIPVSWRLQLDASVEAEIERLSGQLLATWSGVYQPHDRGKIETGGTLVDSDYTTIAAPQVMSSRRFFS